MAIANHIIPVCPFSHGIISALTLSMHKGASDNFEVFMRLLLCLFLIGRAGGADADGLPPDQMQIQLGSRHISMNQNMKENGFEEFNPGATFTWNDRAFGLNYAAGAFRNSFGNLAPVVAISKLWSANYGLKLGLFAGLSYYGDDADFISVGSTSTGVIPIMGLQANYENAYVQLLPTDDDHPGFGFLLVTGWVFPLNKQ